jgi:hypothetical protein
LTASTRSVTATPHLVDQLIPPDAPSPMSGPEVRRVLAKLRGVAEATPGHVNSLISRGLLPVPRSVSRLVKLYDTAAVREVLRRAFPKGDGRGH